MWLVPSLVCSHIFILISLWMTSVSVETYQLIFYVFICSSHFYGKSFPFIFLFLCYGIMLNVIVIWMKKYRVMYGSSCPPNLVKIWDFTLVNSSWANWNIWGYICILTTKCSYIYYLLVLPWRPRDTLIYIKKGNNMHFHNFKSGLSLEWDSPSLIRSNWLVLRSSRCN